MRGWESDSRGAGNRVAGVVRQGEVYWLDLGVPVGSRPAYRHPHVVVQGDALNASRISTTVVCALTSNLRLAHAPGNVALDHGEAGLPKQSVVNVSQVFTIDKDELEDFIGTLSRRRMREVLEGLRLVFEPADIDD